MKLALPFPLPFSLPFPLRWPPAFGRPGAVAVLALLAALPPALLLTPRWQSEAAALRQAGARPAPAPAPAPAPLTAAASAPAPSAPALAGFAETELPAATEAPARVGRLLQLAQRQHLSVERTTQRLDAAPTQPQPRLQLGLSAHGRYAELRAFVAAALQADAALSLDRLQLRRAAAETELLDADLQWSLWQAPRAGEAP